MTLRQLLVVPSLICMATTLSAEDQKAKAQSLVKEAIAFGKKNGKDALLKEANSANGRFHVNAENSLYVFIYDKTGTCLAMGYSANLVNVNRWNLKDADGLLVIQALIKGSTVKGGSWVDYRYLNPKNGQIQPKSSWVEALDDWMVGCGYYK